MNFDISIHEQYESYFVGSISLEGRLEKIQGDLRVWSIPQYQSSWVSACDRVLSGKASLFVVDFPPFKESESITAWNACPFEGRFAFSEVMIEKNGLADEELTQEYHDHADIEIYPEVSIWWVDRDSIISFRRKLNSQVG